MNGEFKSQYTQEQRIVEAKRALTKFPTRVPVIVEVDNESIKKLLNKRKYLVPLDMTAGQFHYVLRKRMKIKPEKALFLFVNKTLPANSTLISDVYSRYKDDDKFLYMVVGLENTFGGALA